MLGTVGHLGRPHHRSIAPLHLRRLVVAVPVGASPRLHPTAAVGVLSVSAVVLGVVEGEGDMVLGCLGPQARAARWCWMGTGGCNLTSWRN